MWKEFTQTLIGSRFTKDLEIYDKYHVEEPKEEVSSEDDNTELYSNVEDTGHEPGLETNRHEPGLESDDRDTK